MKFCLGEYPESSELAHLGQLGKYNALFAIPDSRSKSFKIEPEIKIRESVQIEFGLVRSMEKCMESGCLLFSFLNSQEIMFTIILLNYNSML